MHALEVGNLLLVHLLALEALDGLPFLIGRRELLRSRNFVVHLPLQVLLSLLARLERVTQFADGISGVGLLRCSCCRGAKSAMTASARSKCADYRQWRQQVRLSFYFFEELRTLRRRRLSLLLPEEIHGREVGDAVCQSSR